MVRKGVLEGSGNPERLKYKNEEIYSRRINQKDCHIATDRQHSFVTARLMILVWILLFQLSANNTAQTYM
ncbi:MAG: type II toxin-antitoxin system YoeB family toxin [Spirochaetia bacterium]|nr:type II toxin-antitoxin system YoeB family toxin [Spirochaetia bacterium]